MVMDAVNKLHKLKAGEWRNFNVPIEFLKRICKRDFFNMNLPKSKVPANNKLIIVGFIQKKIGFLKYKVKPPNTDISIPLAKGTKGICFSKRYTTAREIKVAIINGGIANLRLLSFWQYTIKKITRGLERIH